MAAVSDFNVREEGQKLAISWKNLSEMTAISIQVANDADFTHNIRNFIIPAGATSIYLDVGKGEWFARLGSWLGDKTRGVIKYTATYGPVMISINKAIVPLPSTRINAIHASGIIEGVRFNLSTYGPKYIIWEHNTNPKFPANGTTTFYFLDYGQTHLDCLGLTGGLITNVRITTLAGATPSVLPTDCVVMLLPYTVALNKKPLRRIGDGTLTGIVARNSAAVLRKEAEERGYIRFSSHTDYLKYVAAQEAEKRK